MNEVKEVPQKAKLGAFDRAKLAATTFGTTAMVAAGSAMAQDDGFDPSTIEARIVLYTGFAVTLIGAYALGRWTLRAMGLIK